MKRLLALAFICLSASAYAQQGQGLFSFTPAPCDAGALVSGGWCLDVVQAVPPLGPTAPPPPIITGPFATIISKKVQLTGTGVPGDIVSIAIDGNKDPGLVTVAASGSWSFNANEVLTNGTHIATAVQTNNIGTSASSPPFTFAVSAP